MSVESFPKIGIYWVRQWGASINLMDITKLLSIELLPTYIHNKGGKCQFPHILVNEHVI